MVSIEQIKAGSGPLRTRLERDQAASIASRQTKAVRQLVDHQKK